MATNLRRVLDSRRAADRIKVNEIIQEIQSLAIVLRPSPPEGHVFAVEEFGEFFNSMSRPLWQAPAQLTALGEVEVADNKISKEDLKAFSNLPHISMAKLRNNLKAILEGQHTQTLEQVLDRFPPEYGMIEVLGYLLVAMGDAKHYVSEDAEQIITVPGRKPTKWLVPRVLFCE